MSAAIAMEEDELVLEAKELFRDFVANHDPRYGVGSMSCTAYDTAWVSMITKVVHGRRIWLFPESFHCVLASQLEDGSWPLYGSQIDAILNTAASLLSLQRHKSLPLQFDFRDCAELDDKISMATLALGRLLKDWHIEQTVHVGYEVLVPSLLDLLSEEGFHFAFDARAKLMDMYETKMAKFDVEWLYVLDSTQSTIMHSLEALFGKVNYNALSHHKMMGSMMASPSSTAAYLIGIDSWDDESEDYLRHVITACGESGLVPSAFPSTYFEVSWIISTLLKAGFSPQSLECSEFTQMKDILKEGLLNGDGLIGFAPGSIPDADDTAKAIMSLNLAGDEASIEPCINQFDAGSHFRTYPKERNASISANCNVLVSICHISSLQQHHVFQIEKTASLLCDYWWQHTGETYDKWSISQEYSKMLLSQAFFRVLELWAQKRLDNFPLKLIERIQLTLIQVVYLTLQSLLRLKSSSHASQEETAYSIITLACSLRFSLFDSLRQTINSAISKGRKILLNDSSNSNFLWVEKVTYSVKSISRAYSLAALKMSIQADYPKILLPSLMAEFGNKAHQSEGGEAQGIQTEF